MDPTRVAATTHKGPHEAGFGTAVSSSGRGHNPDRRGTGGGVPAGPGHRIAQSGRERHPLQPSARPPQSEACAHCWATRDWVGQGPSPCRRTNAAEMGPQSEANGVCVCVCDMQPPCRISRAACRASPPSPAGLPMGSRDQRDACWKPSPTSPCREGPRDLGESWGGPGKMGAGAGDGTWCRKWPVRGMWIPQPG